jgi:molecular chaperone DnaK (HSP70)
MNSQRLREMYRNRNRRYQEMGIPFPGKKALGVEVENGKCLHLLDSFMLPPVSICRIFTTVSDMQSSIEIHVVQGKNALVSENRSVGRFLLTGIVPEKAGVSRIKVSFQLNPETIFRVCAEDIGSGNRKIAILMENPFGLIARNMETEKLSLKLKGLLGLYGKHRRAVDRNLAAEIAEIKERTTEAVRYRNYKVFPELYIYIDILGREITAAAGLNEGAYAGN